MKRYMIQSAVYSNGDLAAILSAIALTAAATGGNSPHDAAFRRGFATALAAVATATHIEINDIATLVGRSQARVIWPEIEA